MPRASRCGSRKSRFPVPTGTEVLVRVAGAGVCHTDLHVARTDRLRVRRPVTLGHEISGWVHAVAPEAEGTAQAAEGALR